MRFGILFIRIAQEYNHLKRDNPLAYIQGNDYFSNFSYPALMEQTMG